MASYWATVDLDNKTYVIPPSIVRELRKRYGIDVDKPQPKMAGGLYDFWGEAQPLEY